MSESAPQQTEEELSHLGDSVVGAITLRAGDGDSLATFYDRALGLSVRETGDSGVVEMTAAGGATLLRLDSTATDGVAPVNAPRTGLFHVAFRFGDRATLGACLVRAVQAGAAFEGASDHAVSEAVYLHDPEGNGIELYRDRPVGEWPIHPDGTIGMVTEPLDVQALARDAGDTGAPTACDIGHIHLKVSETGRTAAFYQELIGLDERAWYGSSAAFLAEGYYHHHVGLNSWHSRGAAPLAPAEPGLAAYELLLRDQDRVSAAAERLEAAGVAIERTDGRVVVRDPDGTTVALAARA